MNETKVVTSRQRLENFGRALACLESACGQESYSNLELAGLVQMFKVSLELCWKNLRDFLSREGFNAKSPRSMVRTASQAGYLAEEEMLGLLDAIERPNLFSCTFTEAGADEVQRLIKQRYCPVLRSVHAWLEERSEV